MTFPIVVLRQAIDGTLTAIREGRDHVEAIAVAIADEVKRLEQEYESLRDQCLSAIETVEALEAESRAARERLAAVNRNVTSSSQQDMQDAYERAQKTQSDLAQWHERESQLRTRRDEVARRLKSLRATAQEAEVLLVKFEQVTSYLSAEFQGVSDSMQMLQVDTLLGVRLLQMQEEERRALAGRLHDGPMQKLASTAMRVQVEPLSTDPTQMREDFRQRLTDIIGDLRNIVFDLRPPLLDDLGLVPTLRRYAEQWTHTYHIPVRIQLVGLERSLSPTQKVNVFRAVQEALLNVARHASASEVSISLIYGDENVEIEVVDNGVGLDTVDWLHWVETGRMGLSLSRQRLAIHGGMLDIMTGSTSGTRFVIKMPFHKEADA